MEKDPYSMLFIDPKSTIRDVKFLYKERRDRFKKQLTAPCVVLGIPQEISQIYPWINIKIFIQQEPSFLYFTGVNQSNVGLLLLPSGEEMIFLPKVDRVSDFWVGKKLFVGDSESEDVAKKVTGFVTILCIDDIHKHVSGLLHGGNTLGYLGNQLTWVEVLTRKIEDFSKKEIHLQDFDVLHYEQRCVLDESDIFCAKKSNQITASAFAQLLAVVRNFSNEREVVSFVEEKILSQTPYGLNFSTIGASGSNACVLHYEKNDSPLVQGELFLLDFGARWGCVGADVSRTFPLSGTFSYLQRILYEIVLQTQKEVEKKVSPGVTIAELDDFCWTFLSDLLDKEIVCKGGTVSLPYKKSPHGVSHLIGQVVHEGGSRRMYQHKKLQPGCLISNEPGIYGTFSIQKGGIVYKETLGIRLEDDLLITQDGNINLSKDIPKEIKDIETLLIGNSTKL